MSEDDTLHVTMGHVERQGAWVVPAHLHVRVKLGSAELDLRDAVMVPGVTTIRVEVRLGNVEIIVPPGFTAETS